MEQSNLNRIYIVSIAHFLAHSDFTVLTHWY